MTFKKSWISYKNTSAHTHTHTHIDTTAENPNDPALFLCVFFLLSFLKWTHCWGSFPFAWHCVILTCYHTSASHDPQFFWGFVYKSIVRQIWLAFFVAVAVVVVVFFYQGGALTDTSDIYWDQLHSLADQTYFFSQHPRDAAELQKTQMSEGLFATRCKDIFEGCVLTGFFFFKE